MVQTSVISDLIQTTLQPIKKTTIRKKIPKYKYDQHSTRYKGLEKNTTKHKDIQDESIF